MLHFQWQRLPMLVLGVLLCECLRNAACRRQKANVWDQHAEITRLDVKVQECKALSVLCRVPHTILLPNSLEHRYINKQKKSPSPKLSLEKRGEDGGLDTLGMSRTGWHTCTTISSPEWWLQPRFITAYPPGCHGNGEQQLNQLWASSCFHRGPFFQLLCMWQRLMIPASGPQSKQIPQQPITTLAACSCGPIGKIKKIQQWGQQFTDLRVSLNLFSFMAETSRSTHNPDQDQKWMDWWILWHNSDSCEEMVIETIDLYLWTCKSINCYCKNLWLRTMWYRNVVQKGYRL